MSVSQGNAGALIEGASGLTGFRCALSLRPPCPGGGRAPLGPLYAMAGCEVAGAALTSLALTVDVRLTRLVRIGEGMGEGVGES